MAVSQMLRKTSNLMRRPIPFALAAAALLCKSPSAREELWHDEVFGRGTICGASGLGSV